MDQKYYFDLLPLDLLTDILSRFRVSDILPVCQLPGRTRKIQFDINFWSSQACRDFTFPAKVGIPKVIIPKELFINTDVIPCDRYFQIRRVLSLPLIEDKY